MSAGIDTLGGAAAAIPRVTHRSRAFRKFVLLSLGLLFGLIGQVYFMRRQYPLDGTLFYLVAIFLFARAVRGLPAAVGKPVTVATGYSLVRALPAAVLGALAFALFMQERYNPAIIVTMAALLALIVAYWRQGLTETGKIHLEQWEWIAFGGILLLGLLLRLYHLGSFPGTLYLDEGDVGSLGLKMARSSNYLPFVPDFTGHPTFFYYGLGLYLKLVGISIIKLRLYTIAIGMLAIIATYFLGRELLGPRGALIAAFAMAISTWAINFSRVVFDGIAVVLFVALTMFFLLRGLRTRQPMDFIWSGLAIGLGLNTYLAFRVVPLLVLLYLIYKVLGNRSFLRIYAPGLVLLSLALFVSFTPLGVYYLKHPGDLWSRAQSASVFQDIEREKSYAPLWANIRKAFGMFNYQGDPRPRHNLPDNPMVDPITGIFLVLGFGYALLNWRKAENSMLITWLAVGMLPGVFSLADSNPHSLRTITNLPAVCLLAALSAERIDMFARVNCGAGVRSRLQVLAAVVAVIALAANMHVYFDLQANNRSVYYDFDPVQNAVAQEVARLGKTHNMYVAAAYTNHSAVKFLDNGLPYQTFNQAQHLPLRDVGGKDCIFILEPAQRQLVTLFQTYYPGVQIKTWADRFGNPGYIEITVTREEAERAQGVKAAYYAGGDRSSNPALRRTEDTIAADWATAAPLDPPFGVVWTAALFAGRYGQYVLTLESSHPATVTLDSQVAITTTGGEQRASLNLIGGFHNLQVETTVPSRSGTLSLRWKPVDGSEQVIPRSALFTLDLGSNGLLGKYYRGNAWAGAPVIQQKDLFVSPNDLLPAPFSIEWEGKIYAPQDGQYVFATSSDDGSQLWIDNKLVVDNGGHHSERYVEGRTNLTEGLHDIRLRYFQDDGGRTLDLYWVRPGGGKEIVPTSVLFPPGAVISGPIVIAPPSPPVTTPTQPGQTPVAKPPATIGQQIGTLEPVLTIGREGGGQGEFRNPRGVAVDLNGNIYVADTGNKRVQIFDRQGKFLAEWKGGREPFLEPIAIAVAPNGDVYVLEAERDSAQRFSARGEFLGKIGDGLGLYRPRGLTVDGSGVLYFANTGGNNIVRASATGQLLGTVGTAGKGNGQLQQPTDVVIDSAGNIIIADTYNQRIQRFTADGRYLGQWRIPAAGTVAGPHLAVSPDGTVYVTDPDNSRISAYGADGSVLAAWGSQGSGDGQFMQPVGIFMDASGLIYIADTGNSRIQVWAKR